MNKFFAKSLTKILFYIFFIFSNEKDDTADFRINEDNKKHSFSTDSSNTESDAELPSVFNLLGDRFTR